MKTVKNRIIILIFFVCFLSVGNKAVFSQKELTVFGKVGIPLQSDAVWMNSFDWKKPNFGVDLGAIYHINKFFFVGIGAGYHTSNLNTYSHSFFDVYTKTGFQTNIKERVFFHFGTNQGYGLCRFTFLTEPHRTNSSDYRTENIHCFLFAPEFQILVKVYENLFLKTGVSYNMYLSAKDEMFSFSAQLGIAYKFNFLKVK